jgi:hypothetical protein
METLRRLPEPPAGWTTFLFLFHKTVIPVLRLVMLCLRSIVEIGGYNQGRTRSESRLPTVIPFRQGEKSSFSVYGINAYASESLWEGVNSVRRMFPHTPTPGNWPGTIGFAIPTTAQVGIYMPVIYVKNIAAQSSNRATIILVFYFKNYGKICSIGLGSQSS